VLTSRSYHSSQWGGRFFANFIAFFNYILF
jgi:hypothetical protein